MTSCPLAPFSDIGFGRERRVAAGLAIELTAGEPKFCVDTFQIVSHGPTPRAGLVLSILTKHDAGFPVNARLSRDFDHLDLICRLPLPTLFQ